MTKTIWHSGPPPSDGWWPASAYERLDELHWWSDGCWSVALYRSDDVSVVDYFAATHDWKLLCYEVKWRKRPKSWPKRSRT